MQQTYDLKTLNSLTKIKEMVSFERDLWDLFSKIKFRKVSRNFQNQLKENIKAMKKSRNLFVFADKASNIYQIKKGEYNKLTTDAITKRFLTKLTTKLIWMGKKNRKQRRSQPDICKWYQQLLYHFKRRPT